MLNSFLYALSLVNKTLKVHAIALFIFSTSAVLMERYLGLFILNIMSVVFI